MKKVEGRSEKEGTRVAPAVTTGLRLGPPTRSGTDARISHLLAASSPLHHAARSGQRRLFPLAVCQRARLWSTCPARCRVPCYVSTLGQSGFFSPVATGVNRHPSSPQPQAAQAAGLHGPSSRQAAHQDAAARRLWPASPPARRQTLSSREFAATRLGANLDILARHVLTRPSTRAGPQPAQLYPVAQGPPRLHLLQ